MNKVWMVASYHSANRSRDSRRELVRFEYLDVMGLFETGWIVFDHQRRGDNDYGYPVEKT